MPPTRHRALCFLLVNLLLALCVALMLSGGLARLLPWLPGAASPTAAAPFRGGAAAALRALRGAAAFASAPVAGSQARLVEALQRQGVVASARVAAAMRAVDRGRYGGGYADHPSSIGHGQTISAPHMHAVALELLEPVLRRVEAAGGGVRVFDVGAGSGYLCAALAHLGGPSATVVGVEKARARERASAAAGRRQRAGAAVCSAAAADCRAS
jgi:hypothetical protein